MKVNILMDIHTGEIREAVRQLRRVDGVNEAHMIFGPYDAVAAIEAEDVKTLGGIMASAIQPKPGVVDTLTCLAVED